MTEARAELSVLTPDAVNALVGREVTFRLGDRALPFTAEGFLRRSRCRTSFSMRTTAYDILRHKGALLETRFHGEVEIEGPRAGLSNVR